MAAGEMHHSGREFVTGQPAQAPARAQLKPDHSLIFECHAPNAAIPVLAANLYFLYSFTSSCRYVTAIVRISNP